MPGQDPCAPGQAPTLAPSPDGVLQPYSAARDQALEEFDAAYLHSLLLRTEGNVTHAAQLAGKERRALGKMLKQRGIDCSRYRKR
jgi:DNA-binding NtrC family response regulator